MPKAKAVSKKPVIDRHIAPKSSDTILQDGTGTPYLAIFNQQGMPVMNKLTGIPIGAYISQFQYKFDEANPNETTFTFDLGDPDIVDQGDLQEGKSIWAQWGYIYPDGSAACNEPKCVKIRDFNAIFDDTGTHCTLICMDGSLVMATALPIRAGANKEDSMSTFLNEGCYQGIGVVIEKFE